MSAPARSEGGSTPQAPGRLPSAQLEAVTAAVTDAIVTADASGRITGWMGGAARLFGLEAEEAIGRPLSSLVPVHLRPAHEHAFASVAAGGPSRIIGRGALEVEALRADGTTVPVELTLGRGGHGEDAFFVGVLRDVTARRLAEDRLRVAQERFTSAFEHAPIGMTMSTPAGRYLRVNRAFTELVGLGHLELDDRSWEDFTHPVDVPGERAARERLLEGLSASEVVQKRMLHRDGTERWVEASIALVHDPAGAPLHFLSHFRDIDAQRRAQAELERSNRELEDLAAVASHDLRVPLSTVAGLLEVLRRTRAETLDGDGLELVGHAADAVGRMQELIDSLLRLARLDGGTSVHLEDVDVDALAREIAAGLEAPPEAVQVQGLPVLHTDRALLRQVLQNLLANALRHAPRDAPRIGLTAQRLTECWVVSVADNGPGVPPAERERVFERFHRGSRHGAAGLGLAICRSAVERLGGRIWFADAPGGGADVRFTLPG